MTTPTPAADGEPPGAPERPAEERSYLAFMAAALTLALGAGLVLALLIPLAPALRWRLDEEALVQAHGWAQLGGWLGLFVAGMSLRMVPRLGHRPPLPPPLPVTVLGLIASGTLLRLVGQVGAGGGAVPALLLPASVLQAAGMAGVAAALGWTLARGRRRRESWRGPAWASAGWWAVWAALTVVAGVEATAGGGVVAPEVDAASAWVVMLGAVGNMIWAVQARSVPVFYGRRPPRHLAAPAAVYNLGAALVLASAAGALAFLRQPGLALAGVGLLWLAPAAGSVRGRPHRLRPPSRPAARFVVTANRWAMAAGACMVLGALATGWAGGAARLDDAALHLLGLGLATTLIVGMARLVAPVFAIARATPARRERTLDVTWGALVAATAARLAAALLQGVAPPGWYGALLALAGLLTWTGLAVFAASFGRAWRRQAGRREALARAAGTPR